MDKKQLIFSKDFINKEEKAQISLILMDHQMPILNRIETTKKFIK